MVHKAVEVGAFFNDMNTALIAVLPKPNKDASKCGKYRPLSILNAEIKIFARILAFQLEPHITMLIKNDQTGFVKSRLASDNVQRLLHVIYAAKDIPSPCAVLSLDAEKAFGRLEWEYLWMVLQRFNLGPTFISLIKLLYNNSSAMVNMNGVISDKFNLSRSCRQGCPLRPFLFLSSINWKKSALLPLNSQLSLSSLLQHIPVVNHFKYLGVDIFPSLSITANKNFQSIYNNIETDLNRWSHLPKSLQACVSIVKMDILLRIHFFSSMLP